MDAHYFGALYDRALGALLSAMNSGLPTLTLKALARRVSRALAGLAENIPQQQRAAFASRVKQRVHGLFIEHTGPILWGARTPIRSLRPTACRRNGDNMQVCCALALRFPYPRYLN
jgi:hypothetical protein